MRPFRDALRCRELALLCGGLLAVLGGGAKPVRAQNCASMDPADWPQPAKPYFLIVADTSGSMAACTNPETAWPTSCPGGATPNSCGWLPYRANDAKCAIRNTILAFSGQVNFGLATFSHTLSGCPSACNLGIANGWYAFLYNGCTFNGADGCAGASIAVDLLRDTQPPQPSNVGALLQYMDNNCADNKELFAYDGTPLGASLSNVLTYLQNGFGGHPSPLTANDPPCRSLNVILLTDGGESCGGDPVAAAQALYNGFTKDGIFRRVYTHVIAFNVDSPADQTTLDNIHKMGQCGSTTGACASSVHPYPANNEVELSSALASIIAGAIPPEVCDNADNNCNGCVDEGFVHYCNENPVCCSWSSDAQRSACIASYLASISSTNPTGDQTLLPCTTRAQQQQDSRWLCYDPGESCDGADNNCNGQVDEDLPLNNCGTCGPPPPEIPCNGIDDDCDPSTPDEPAGCLCGQEFCDGVDNDCDGLIDQNDPDYVQGNEPCGPNPPLGECQQGTLQCNYPGAPTCVGAVYPTAETCDGRDENCNGVVDDVVYDPPECVIPNCQTACCDGHWACVGGEDTCVPNAIQATETCNGIDDDCDGRVDEGAECPQPDVCWFGSCEGRIPPDGCGPDLVERDGLCVHDPCRGTVCPGGTVCEPATGDCVDPCDPTPCTAPGTACDVTLATCDASGTCSADESACVTADCYLDPSLCGDGEVCKAGVCVADPCFGTNPLDCGQQACRDATCIATCVGVSCDVGERCEDGVCVVADCGTFSCPPGQTCVDGQCAQNPCGGVTCGVGRICKDGTCVDDPCRLVVCPAGSVCISGQCVEGGNDAGVLWPEAGPRPEAGPGRDSSTEEDGGGLEEDFQITAGGGGCACQGGSDSPSGMPAGPLLLLGLGLLWRRRARRRVIR